MKFEFQPNVPPSSEDFRIQKEYLNAMYNKRGETICSKQFEERFYEWIDGLESHINDAPCWLLGHPHFTQEDIRTPRSDDDGTDENNNKKNRSAWLSLISFESDGDDLLMFGDAGAATVLVPAENLKTLELSRTWYSWDCS